MFEFGVCKLFYNETTKYSKKNHWNAADQNTQQFLVSGYLTCVGMEDKRILRLEHNNRDVTNSKLEILF